MRIHKDFGFASHGLGAWGLIVALVFVSASPTLADTWLEADKLLASDGHQFSLFGYTVAIDGDTAIVGAWLARGEGEEGDSRGAAYVFMRDDSGNWSEQAKLVPRDSRFNHFFGYSVDIDGDTAIVSNSEDDLNSFSDSAYIFVRDASGNWTEQAELRASDGTFGDAFAFDVAIDGDTALAGTRPETQTGFVDLPGAVYVFVRDSSGAWNEQAKLLASDSAIGDTFGRHVDLDGDLAIIGRHRNDDDGTGSVRTSAYIFTRDAAGNWNEDTKLVANERTNFEGEFGSPRPVAIDGTTAIMGAGRAEDGRSLAYVFGLDHAGIWTEEAELTASDGVPNDGFGSSVALSGDTLVIGAPDNSENGSRSGSAYIFTRDTSGDWSEEAKLLASDGASDDVFGWSVSIDEGTAVIGAWGDEDNGFASGSAYVFQLAEAIAVDINIRPHQELNRINPSSRQKIAVVILATDTFDALQVDPLSVKFGPSGAVEIHGRGHVKDIDRDGDMDLLLHFEMRDTGIACGDRVATLGGETFSKQSITGSDSVEPVPCK